MVLAADRTVVRVTPELVRAALSRKTETTINETVTEMLQQANIRPRRRGPARESLLRELLASSHVDAGWLLRCSPDASLLAQARELDLPRLLGLLLGAHTLYFGLWIMSWWLLGWIALQGHLKFGWLLAWGLILLSLIPFRILETCIGGRLAIRAGALLKRRLLFGALKLDPDQVRRQGAGQLLGRVVEADVLDTMAFTGGFYSLTASVELLLGCVVLGFGAGGPGHVLLLAAAVVAAILLGMVHYRRRRRWTDHRYSMTDDLVERMVGHRTRLAQEPRENWNLEEDQVLENYLGLSARLDRTAVWLKVLVPRGWFLIALVGLAPAFVFGDPKVAALGIAVGGILVTYRALQNLAEGLERLAAAAIAWERIKLFCQKATLEKRDSAPQLIHLPRRNVAATVNGQPSSQNGKPGASNGKPNNGRPPETPTLLEVRDLAYRYRGRNNPVLERINMKIRAGQQILLEGQSGGGKSTLGALLASLRDPESGLLLLEGLDRRTLGESEWRRRVVMAPQFHDNHVLLGTFAFNLLMGRRWPPSKQDLEEADGVCRALGLGPLLDRMPAGLQQMVGETGWQLSHGERSRLYLARALLQGADLVILDETLAALDPQTLRKSLAYVLKRTPTVLLIAHP